MSTSSQNSDLLRDLCHTLVKHKILLLLCFLQFVLLTQTPHFAIHVELEVFLEISPIQHQFRPIFPQLTRTYCVLSYCLNLSPLLETFYVTVNCCYVRHSRMREPARAFTRSFLKELYIASVPCSNSVIPMECAQQLQMTSQRNDNLFDKQLGGEPVSGSTWLSIADL